MHGTCCKSARWGPFRVSVNAKLSGWVHIKQDKNACLRSALSIRAARPHSRRWGRDFRRNSSRWAIYCTPKMYALSPYSCLTTPTLILLLLTPVIRAAPFVPYVTGFCPFLSCWAVLTFSTIDHIASVIWLASGLSTDSILTKLLLQEQRIFHIMSTLQFNPDIVLRISSWQLWSNVFQQLIPRPKTLSRSFPFVYVHTAFNFKVYSRSK